MLSMEKLEAQRRRGLRLYHEVEAPMGLVHRLELGLPRSQDRVGQALVCWSASRGPGCCLYPTVSLSQHLQVPA